MEILNIGGNPIVIHPVVAVVLAVVIGLPIAVWLGAVIAGFIMVHRERRQFLKEVREEFPRVQTRTGRWR